MKSTPYPSRDFAAARALQEQSLVVCRELGNKNLVASALFSLGTVAGHQGDCKTSNAWNHESLALYRSIGEPDARGFISHMQAGIE